MYVGNMISKTYKVKDMHCSSCAMLIEAELEDQGVKAKCNFAKATLEVEYNESKFDEAKIRSTVKQAGYTLSSL